MLVHPQVSQDAPVHDENPPDSHHMASVVGIRIQFLFINVILLFLCIVAGAYVYGETQSLTVEVDLISFSCDTLALVINISIELAKTWVTNQKHALIMDLVGFTMSLGLLVGVALFGLASSVKDWNSDNAIRHAEHVSHLELMVCYAMFTLSVNMMVISLFLCLRALMLPKTEGGGNRDELNVRSSVAHACAGYVSSFAVLGTSVFLMFFVPRDVPILEKARQKVKIDVFGSVAVCLVICVSVVQIAQEAVHTLDAIKSFDPEASKLPVGDEGEDQSYGAAATAKDV